MYKLPETQWKSEAERVKLHTPLRHENNLFPKRSASATCICQPCYIERVNSAILQCVRDFKEALAFSFPNFFCLSIFPDRQFIYVVVLFLRVSFSSLAL